MVKLMWLESAKDDLRSIYEYIALDSKRYAKYQVKQIRDRTSILKDNPKARKIVLEYENESVREVICGHHRIIYRIINSNFILILLIHHGARICPRIDKE